jgi:hypothetical protein
MKASSSFCYSTHLPTVTENIKLSWTFYSGNSCDWTPKTLDVLQGYKCCYVFQDDQLLLLRTKWLRSPFALHVTTPRVRYFNWCYGIKSGPGVMKRKISHPSSLSSTLYFLHKIFCTNHVVSSIKCTVSWICPAVNQRTVLGETVWR